MALPGWARRGWARRCQARCGSARAPMVQTTIQSGLGLLRPGLALQVAAGHCSAGYGQPMSGMERQGTASRGAVGQGVVRHVEGANGSTTRTTTVRYGAVRQATCLVSQCLVRPGGARCGWARFGSARYGMAMRGSLWLKSRINMVRRCLICCGVLRFGAACRVRGLARYGRARLCLARLVDQWSDSESNCGAVRLGVARHDRVGSGASGFGKPRAPMVRFISIGDRRNV